MHSGIEKTSASHFQHAATKPCTNESNKKRLGFSLYQSYINSEDLQPNQKGKSADFSNRIFAQPPGWHICSLELWIWWHLLYQLSKELLEESRVPQALPLRCVCQIGFQDHSRSPLFPKFSASFVVQGTWLRPPQRCHHPQRPDVAPHVLPRCLLRWLFELVIDRDRDPGTNRIGSAFQKFPLIPNIARWKLHWVRCVFSGWHANGESSVSMSILSRNSCSFHGWTCGHSPLRSENFLISRGHCDPEGIAEFLDFSRYCWWKKS